MTTRDQNGRFTRTPATFTQRVEAEVWRDLESQLRHAHQHAAAFRLDYETRAMLLTVAFDTAAERLQWLGVAA